MIRGKASGHPPLAILLPSLLLAQTSGLAEIIAEKGVTSSLETAIQRV
ncbi:MAG: hypothetical protein NXY59_09350 [Aigarchaeota archaeon]|nr:hypothetical protein [Candidatus Pelearchaeum maunauluense]